MIVNAVRFARIQKPSTSFNILTVSLFRLHNFLKVKIMFKHLKNLGCELLFLRENNAIIEFVIPQDFDMEELVGLVLLLKLKVV